MTRIHRSIFTLPSFTFALLALLMTAQPAKAIAIKPSAQEMKTNRLWLDEHLLKARFTPSSTAPIPQTPLLPQPGLDVYANNDPVIPNGRGNSPIRIGDKEYTHGLYVHAISKIVVHLPGPGKSFTAVVGLDHNDDTARGKGSVVFSVKVKDQVIFQTDVMRFATPAREVNVNLGGADTFTLEVGDAGDGIGWDQSDWADAKATLNDGKELWLGDMPIRDHRITGALPTAHRTSDLPFSFLYGGQPSDQLLATWPKKTATRQLDSFRREHTFTWTDPRTGLQVRCMAVDYKDYPVVEWTVYFTNMGKANSPILESIQGLDTQFERSTAGEFVLRGSKGDWDAPEGYQPYEDALPPDTTKRFAPDGGRPTNGPNGWPYYNLTMPGGGTIMAIGWPGQWACSFVRDSGAGLRVAAGQELTHLYLKPGEEIRSPLTALLFWQGADTVRAQNLWRRWFMAHNIPHINGQPPATMAQMQCYKSFENGGEQDLFETVNAFNKASIHYDLCWRDAGWYPCNGHWPNTGTWEVDPQRYPKGFRPFSDWLHAQGKKFIVWFEPERVGDPNSWLGKNHPEWLLGGTLLNLGSPEAWNWLVNHIDTLIREQGIDYYRQDFNMDPLSYWRQNDAPDRQGITENLHVQGYLAYWDELRRRHPTMLIDSCASGGRRNDLETLRRAVPLLRSDYQFGPDATMPNQSQTYGISSWIPYYGSGTGFTDKYSARSYYMPCFGFGGSNAATKQAYDECRKVAPSMLGDYYPLTPYSLQHTDWIAWQFNRPETGEGIIQAFRRDKNDEPSKVFHLSGLSASTRYEVTNFDTGIPITITGKALMETGITVEIKTEPGSAVIGYKVVGGKKRR